MMLNMKSIAEQMEHVSPHFIVYYPRGETMCDGQLVNNCMIAERIIAACRSEQRIPRTIAAWCEDNSTPENQWRIEPLPTEVLEQ